MRVLLGHIADMENSHAIDGLGISYTGTDQHLVDSRKRVRYYQHDRNVRR